MNILLHHDLQFALLRCPKVLLQVMKQWGPRVVVGGGFLRASIAREDISDVDVFTQSKDDAYALAELLVRLRLGYRPIASADDLAKKAEEDKAVTARIHITDNAYTLTCFHPVVQIIHRWTYRYPEDIIDSFDFTVAKAVFWHERENGNWRSLCHDRFYPDLAAKRIVYTSPIRNEDAGGSMLRVLKFYQKGYRIPLDSLGRVIARLCGAYEPTKEEWNARKLDEGYMSKIFTGLLREVDPNIDPSHVAHLPAEETTNPNPITENHKEPTYANPDTAH